MQTSSSLQVVVPHFAPVGAAGGVAVEPPVAVFGSFFASFLSVGLASVFFTVPGAVLSFAPCALDVGASVFGASANATVANEPMRTAVMIRGLMGRTLCTLYALSHRVIRALSGRQNGVESPSGEFCLIRTKLRPSGHQVRGMLV